MGISGEIQVVVGGQEVTPCADMKLGDLTVLVGPQGAGKGSFLQSLWAEFNGRRTLMRGRHEVYGARKTPRLRLDGQAENEKAFFIPARRDLALQAFPKDLFCDQFAPPAYYDFFDVLREYLCGVCASNPTPDDGMIPGAILDQVSRFVLEGGSLVCGHSNGIALQAEEGMSRPLLSLSLGQLSFVSLMLGACAAIHSQKKNPSERITRVLIEEPELGLHPLGVLAAMGLVLMLLDRGISVVLSTHSPAVIDVIWGLRLIQGHRGTPLDAAEALMLSGEGAEDLVRSALTKSYRTYYFSLDGAVRDISSLDPGSEDPLISGWGGLTGISDHIGEVVSRVVQ